jgi:hypothetical protein
MIAPYGGRNSLAERLMRRQTGRHGEEGASSPFSGEGASSLRPLASILVTLSLLLWFALPLLVLVAVVDLATASPSRRALILRRSGMSQTAIALRLGVSRYRVRQYLAA